MFPIKALAVAAVLAALVVAPTATAAETAQPVAGVAGGDVAVLVYPSIVNVPFVRTRAALQRAVDHADDPGDQTGTAKAVASLTVARAQLKKAWTGEKYLIDHAPPPIVGDSLDGPAIVAGAPVAGASPFASAEDSGAELFNLYHEVATTAVGMSDTAKTTLQSALSTTIFAALNQRDAAIKYIHDHQPAAPPVGDSLGVDASGAPVAAGWSGVMPNVASYIEDEIQQLDALQANTSLSAGAKRVLGAAELQDTRTLRTINQWWPPAPVGD